ITQPPVEDDVSDVLDEWLIDEAPEPPAAQPQPNVLATEDVMGPAEVVAGEPPLAPSVEALDEAEVVAALLQDEPPAPPPAAPPQPAALPVPATITRQRFIDLP